MNFTTKSELRQAKPSEEASRKEPDENAFGRGARRRLVGVSVVSEGQPSRLQTHSGVKAQQWVVLGQPAWPPQQGVPVSRALLPWGPLQRVPCSQEEKPERLLSVFTVNKGRGL